MECGDITGVETLLRSALRVVSLDPLCLAFAADTSYNGRMIEDCDRLPATTILMAAFSDGFIAIADDAELLVPMDCDNADTTLNLISKTLLSSLSGRYGIGAVYITGDTAANCDSECSDLTLEDKVRKTFVHSTDFDGPAMRIANAGKLGPLTCDQDGIGIESLLHAALADMGDGTFAWRVTTL
jgi:hypothetical protein